MIIYIQGEIDCIESTRITDQKFSINVHGVLYKALKAIQKETMISQLTQNNTASTNPTNLICIIPVKADK